jgi:hypothetical protein
MVVVSAVAVLPCAWLRREYRHCGVQSTGRVNASMLQVRGVGNVTAGVAACGHHYCFGGARRHAGAGAATTAKRWRRYAVGRARRPGTIAAINTATMTGRQRPRDVI